MLKTKEIFRSAQTLRLCGPPALLFSKHNSPRADIAQRRKTPDDPRPIRNQLPRNAGGGAYIHGDTAQLASQPLEVKYQILIRP